MSEEKSGQGVRVGEYELEGRYHDVGPDLGRLYEAHHVHTGIRGLVLMPGPASKWKLSGPWSVRVAYDPGTAPSVWRIHAPTGSHVPRLRRVGPGPGLRAAAGGLALSREATAAWEMCFPPGCARCPFGG